MRMRPGFRCLLTASLVCAAGVPAWSAAARRASLIAFDRAIDGSGRIHVIGADGRGDRAITPESGFETPVWSPDGSSLVYESGGGLANSELYAYGMSTRAVRRLTRHRGLDAFPAWSPDGSRIAWTTQRGAALEIWVMRRDGTRARKLTSGPADSHPAWSPDGSAIAYVNLAGGALEVVDVGPARVHVLARQTDMLSTPAWSPDGRFLVFADRSEHLETISSDGRARRVLTRGIASDANPTWRPARS